MESMAAAEKRSGVEASDGGLKQLVLRWFTETQASLIVTQGNFPDWFQGFAGRKEAEDLLRDKPLGCFLVRLTDKTVGYILSYRGLDRCRHFVINQNLEGQFVIAGDCQTYQSLTELIQYYKVNSIQPFGEHLTCSCLQESEPELYDVVTFKPKQESGVNVQALKNLWEQSDVHHTYGNQRPHKQQHEPALLQPPVLPPKSKSRKLTGTVSADTSSLCQGPPVQKRGVPLSFSLSGSLPDTWSHLNESQLSSIGSEGHTRTTHSPLGHMTSPLPPRVESRSLPPQECEGMEEEEEEEEEEEVDEEEEEEKDQLSLSFTASGSHSALFQKRVTCHTYSLYRPSGQRSESFRSERGGPVTLRPNPLYQTVEAPGGGSAQQQREVLYSQLSERPPPPAGLPDDTYEQIPEQAAAPSNTYESVDNMRTKKSKSTWGKNSMSWIKFIPEPKKK